jgi:GNAT superfamily N-acetyltransferase
MGAITELVIAKGTTVIRASCPEDRDAVHAMARGFIGETAYRDVIGEDSTPACALLDRFISGELGQLFVAENVERRIVGMVAVLVFTNPVTARLTGSELVWWVEPHARSTRAGLRLMRAAEQWAFDKGAREMQFVSWNAKLDVFYDRCGYAPMERVYMKSLEG